jgi:hypothetical protein
LNNLKRRIEILNRWIKEEKVLCFISFPFK